MAVASIPVHLFTGGNHVPDVDPNEWLLSTGIRSAKFDNIGDSVVGIIVGRPELQQQRDFETRELKVWSDGNPMLQVRVVLATDLRDPEDPEDSGERAVFIRGNMREAVAQALRAAGAERLEAGGKLLIKYVADGKPARRGFNPPKHYEAKYRAPAGEVTPVADPVRETVPAAAASASTNHKDEVPF